MARYTAYQSIELTVPANTNAGTVITQQQLFKGTFDPGYVTGFLVQEVENDGSLTYEVGMDVGNGFSIVDFVVSDVVKPNMSVEPDKKFLSVQPQDCNTYIIFKVRTINSVPKIARLRATFRVEDLSPAQATARTGYSQRRKC